jgi:hypothetical protein
MKPIENLMVKRKTSIVIYLNDFFPKDISNLISTYDYYLEGTSTTLRGHSRELKPPSPKG